MNLSKNQLIAIGIVSVGTVATIAIPALIFNRNKRYEIDSEAALKIKLKEIEAGYPDSYWEAKKAKEEARIEIEKARIESNERLTKDARDREAKEQAEIRAFEQNAPDSYWEAKKAEAREETQRQLNAEQIEFEREALRERNRALKDATKMVSDISNKYQYLNLVN